MFHECSLISCWEQAGKTCQVNHGRCFTLKLQSYIITVRYFLIAIKNTVAHDHISLPPNKRHRYTTSTNKNDSSQEF